LLAMHFNRIKAVTHSLHFEPIELLMKRVPPGGMTLESHFTTVFHHFVKDYVLPDWEHQVPTQPGTESKNQADAAYIDLAKRNGLPLITNEGYGQNGIVDEKMRKLAKDAGVAVFAPREFYPGKVNEAAEIEDFLRRFKKTAPAYMEKREKELGEDDIGKLLGFMYGHYRMILRGEVEGRSTPVRLSVI
jgi:hypothetical protein